MPVTIRRPLLEAQLPAAPLNFKSASKVVAEKSSSSPPVALHAPVDGLAVAIEDYAVVMAVERQISVDPAALQGHHSSIAPPLS